MTKKLIAYDDATATLPAVVEDRVAAIAAPLAGAGSASSLIDGGSRIARARVRPPGLLPSQVVCSTMLAYAAVTSTGSDTTGHSARGTFRAETDFTQLQINVVGFYGDVGNGELPGPATKWRVVLEAGGSVYPLYIGGVRTGTVEGFGVISTLPLGTRITRGTNVAVRAYLQSDSSAKILTGAPTGGPQFTTQPVGDGRDLAGDTIDTVGSTYSGVTTLLAPIVITGVPVTPVACMLGLGDSIMYGVGEAATSSSFLARAMATVGIALLRYAQSGQKLQNFIRDPSHWPALAAGFSDVFEFLGANDMGTSVQTLKNYKILLWRKMAATSGGRVWTGTLTPRTNSTDSWATLVNQTVVAGYEGTGTRGQLNDWKRDGAPFVLATGVGSAVGATGAGIVRVGDVGHPLYGVIEIADTVESSRNSGLWKVNGTANYANVDLAHPSPAGHALMAAAFPAASAFALAS